MIPDEGRDVQCSSCGNVWYQPHPDQLAEPPEPPVEEALPPRRPDPAVMNILREEAERERAARAAETAGLESQPELDMPPPAPREPVADYAEAPGMGGAGLPPDDDDEARAVRAAPRRSLLPDIEEINSSLSPSGEGDLSDQPIAAASRRAREGRGRRVGFAISVGVFAALTLLYAQGPRIAAAVPAFEPSIRAYVDRVDRGRRWLDTALRNAANSSPLTTGDAGAEGEG